MLLGFAKLLRLLWPFLKESILQGGTVGTWLLRNIITLFWIFMLLSMLGIVLYMGDVARQLQGRVMYLQGQNATLQTQSADSMRRLTSLRAKIAAERLTTATLTSNVASFNAWRAKCGLPVGPPPADAPCPTKATAAKRIGPRVLNLHPPVPKPKPKKESAEDRRLIDRLRAILKLPNN